MIDFETPMMLRPIFRAALLAAIAGTSGLPFARADIYTWGDASGSINVSNLRPPEGVRVISVTHTSAQAAAQRDAAREAARRAETQALEERVRQLENETEAAKRRPAPQVVYREIPAPLQYRIDPVAPPIQYSVYSSPPAYAAGCDAAWMDCGLGWFPNVYSTGVVFVRASSFRRFSTVPVRHRFAVRQPARSFGHFGRG